MKIGCVLVLCLLLLSGCRTQEVMETVSDEVLIPVMAQERTLNLQLPETAAEPVFSEDGKDRLYFCDGYTLTIQTLPGGNLDRTLRDACGYSSGELTVLKTIQGTSKRYDWVYSCAGEAEEQVGRAAILDDGLCHYCVTAMAPESDAGRLEQQWDRIFASLSLSDQAS